MCLPMTNRQTVIGVANSNPGSPHSQVQNTAAISTATADIPVFLPYNQGSITLLLKSSKTTNSAIVMAGGNQPAEIAIDRLIGMAAAIHGPMYGMNRSVVAMIPHRIAAGTPTKNNPTVTEIPNDALITNSISKYRLTRAAASSSTWVVTGRRLRPSRRMNRSRMSSRRIKKKITRTTTTPTSPNTSTNRPKVTLSTSSGLVGSERMRTENGRCCVPSDSCCSSASGRLWLMSFAVAVIRFNTEPNCLFAAWNFSRMLSWYSGNFGASSDI